MKIVNIHDAKTHLSKYLQDVADGHEVIIGRYNQPVAKLVPYEAEKPKYQLGLLQGQVTVVDSFDAPEERVTMLFEGRL